MQEKPAGTASDPDVDLSWHFSVADSNPRGRERAAMSLSTVMHTALSGMSAATSMVQVAASNLANLQTPGFKQSRIQIGTQTPQTVSLGIPPDGDSAGVNPVQLGSGVITTGVDLDWSQGTIVSVDQPPLLALEGEGLFILASHDGERVYTRDGHFSLNAEGELVANSGERLLGYGVDADGQLQTGDLSPLMIRLGSQIAGEDGRPATLRSFSINRTGRITGRYSDGRTRALGQLRLARFNNPHGLAQRAGNKFQAMPAAGNPNESNPGEGGAGEVISGAIELSNVDLGRQLIDLTLAGNMFRANAAVFQTADTLLGELFFPYRR
jgi:flagellar hook protein FlgE